MSLDVYLTMKSVQNLPTGPTIFIREDGQMKEISRAEWDERWLDREPVVTELSGNDTVYHDNITHNLGVMAGKARIYQCLWRPDEIGIKVAGELIELLRVGLFTLKTDPDKYREYNPENGWGTYEVLVSFVEQYLVACKEYPNAEVSVWR